MQFVYKQLLSPSPRGETPGYAYACESELPGMGFEIFFFHICSLQRILV